MRKKSSIISTILLIIILLVGLSVMLYPTISDWWNSKTQSRAIATYSQAVEQMDDSETQLTTKSSTTCQPRFPTLTRLAAMMTF